jgi:hypothetical protein
VRVFRPRRFNFRDLCMCGLEKDSGADRCIGCWRDPRIRFFEHVEITDACWLWTGATSDGGYGVFWDGDRLVKAHRFAYEHFVGPIPPRHDVDHVRARGCTNRHCVNPAHLEAVTRAENLRRGANVNRAKTHCPQNHAYAEHGYVNQAGRRRCRVCQRAASRRSVTKRANLGCEEQPAPAVATFQREAPSRPLASRTVARTPADPAPRGARSC